MTEMRAVRALVGTTYFTNAQYVERGCVEGAHKKTFRPLLLNQDGLTSSRQIGNRKIPTNLKWTITRSNLLTQYSRKKKDGGCNVH